MGTLKIVRVNSKKFLVKEGSNIVRECKSYKEAMNALISEDIIMLNNVDEFLEDDYDYSYLLDGVA